MPTLVLPPQAGHASSIVDYGRDQSQMMTLRDAGLDRLFAVDWIPATAQTADWSIEEYVAVLGDIVEWLGGRVNLVGDCQGGWLAVVYAGLHPEQVNTLTIGGAPIDTHAGQSAIQEWTRMLARRNELGLYRTLVRAGGGVQRGEHQLTGFKLLEPGAEIEHLFVHNELARGVLVVGGEPVDLAAIDCPIFLLAGTKDHITPAEQVWALADLVSTPAEYIERELVDAGHLGLFMGRAALAEHWRPIAERVRSHSGRDA